MEKKIYLTMIFCLFMTFNACGTGKNAKTLVVYYSFTNNVHTVVADLCTQIDADVVRVEPAEEGIDYAANNYAAGSALISAIRDNPADAASYPAIKPVNIDFAGYDMIVVAAPLWWSNMAAPLQTFLFENGRRMAGKNIGLIVSSASSGISGVVADAKRLIPEGKFLEPNLWIRSSQTSDCHSKIAKWLADINYDGVASAVTEVKGDADVELVPASGNIRVKGDFSTVSLYSASGCKLIESAEACIGTSALVPGIYVAQIFSKGHTTARKIRIIR